MNRYEKSNSFTGGLKDIAQIPINEFVIEPITIINTSERHEVTSVSYDTNLKTLTMNVKFYFREATDDTQLEYSSIIIRKNDGSTIGKVVLSDVQIISNCRVYELIMEIHEETNVVNAKVYVRTLDDKLSVEISDDTVANYDFRYASVYSERLSEYLSGLSNRYNSTYNNMVELLKYNDGVLHCGERIMDGDFNSYKFVPYPYKITLTDEATKLFYCQWEGRFYAHKKIGDKVHYIKLEPNKRELNVPAINDTMSGYEIPVDMNDYTFIGEGIIYGNGKFLNYKGRKHESTGDLKFMHTSKEPYTVVNTALTTNPIQALEYNSYKNYFMRYGEANLGYHMTLYGIENGVMKFKADDRYAFLVKSINGNVFYSDENETFVSPTKSIKGGKFYHYREGRKSTIDLNDMRFNYYEPVDELTLNPDNMVVLGRAVYKKENKNFYLI